MPTQRLERFEIQDPLSSRKPDSLVSLFYILRVTFLRLSLHVLAVTCLTTHLYGLPWVYAYNKIAPRLSFITEIISNATLAQMRNLLGLYRLCCVLHPRPRALQRDEAPAATMDTSSIELRLLDTLEEHDTLQEVTSIVTVNTAQQLAGEVSSTSQEAICDDAHGCAAMSTPSQRLPMLHPILDHNPADDSCPVCTKEPLEFTLCSQERRVSSLRPRAPRRVRSDGSFERPPSRTEAWRPQRQPAPIQKKSGKLQKKRSKS